MPLNKEIILNYINACKEKKIVSAVNNATRVNKPYQPTNVQMFETTYSAKNQLTDSGHLV